jgi:hypothetical protein
MTERASSVVPAETRADLEDLVVYLRLELEGRDKPLLDAVVGALEDIARRLAILEGRRSDSPSR